MACFRLRNEIGAAGYNMQTAVDTGTHIIVTHEVTNQGFDRDQLGPMAIPTKDALHREDLYAIADKGYFSGPESLACHEAGITTTVPRPATSGNGAKSMYVKADFAYDPERDVYVCPAGEDLIYRYTTEERGVRARRYWINECQTCPLHRRTPFRRDQGLDGAHAFPDPEAEERPHRDGPERHGLQHQAGDLPDQYPSPDAGHSGMIRTQPPPRSGCSSAPQRVDWTAP